MFMLSGYNEPGELLQQQVDVLHDNRYMCSVTLLLSVVSGTLMQVVVPAVSSAVCGVNQLKQGIRSSS